MINALFYLLLLLTPLHLHAESSAYYIPPPAKEVFQLSAKVSSSDEVLLQWDIKSGYYLYRDRISVHLQNTQSFRLAHPIFPKVNKHIKEFNETYPVYAKRVIIRVPIKESHNSHIVLRVNYQGCSAKGFCYPMQMKLLSLPVNLKLDGWQKPLLASFPWYNTPKYTQSAYDEVLGNASFFKIIIIFFAFGLALSFTPCVLPMLPIIGSIILGSKTKGALKGFLISLSYVLGMATVYALLGLCFSWLGVSLQVILQQDWAIIIFGFVFLFLGCSMFGLYEFSIGSRWQTAINRLSAKQKAGRYFGVYCMGALATLVLSPCATAPLASALLFVSQSGRSLLEGALALFFMGFGSGVLVIVLGLGGAKWIPKSGRWTMWLYKFMGTLLLALSVMVFSKVFSHEVIIRLWILWLFVILLLLMLSIKGINYRLRVLLSVLCCAYLVIFAINAYDDLPNPWNPFAIGSNPNAHVLVNFIRVDSVNDIAREMRSNKAKPIILDFYASWCVACQDMEKQLFTDKQVAKALRPYLLLRVDLSHMSLQRRELMRHYFVVAPPTMIFFDRYHKEINQARLVGGVSRAQLLGVIKSLPESSVARSG